MDRPITLLHLMTGLPMRPAGATGEVELPGPSAGFDLAQLLAAIPDARWVEAD
ncbi:MAG: hypothetical protein QNK05_12740 [Myxococcota bacterium]|nr:hypothetical protein [Myxococcota bacterium]